MFRSSRPEEFCKKGLLRNFAKFTGKHLCQSLFDKVTGLRPVQYTVLEIKFWSVKYTSVTLGYAKILRLTETYL